MDGSLTNGDGPSQPSTGPIDVTRGSRSEEYMSLSSVVQPLIKEFIEEAEQLEDPSKGLLIQDRNAEQLMKRPELSLPDEGQGQSGLVAAVDQIFKHSVNTWHQGFMSKLYASPNPVGLISELILATLNTNVHARNVSPALTVIEKEVGRVLAQRFGLVDESSGGLIQQGGSAANLTALVVARNTMFPKIKESGYSGGSNLVLFTSAHGHYSMEKAAQVMGLGSKAVWSVKVNADGLIDLPDLRHQINIAREQGCQPFFVNATAGTTVLGSYDDLTGVGQICREEKLWFHVDASWGGAVVFSTRLKHKMNGSHLADTITYNPHKMLNVPVTCSYLLVKDMVGTWRSNTLPADYLFHGDGQDDDTQLPMDLADMTLQCGRRDDALKLALSWIYYGTKGFEVRIDGAFAVAQHFAELVQKSEHLYLVSSNPPPCLQVCFYYAPSKTLMGRERNTKITKAIAKRLYEHNFSVDFAPGKDGHFLRAVVSLETVPSTVHILTKLVTELGQVSMIDGP